MNHSILLSTSLALEEVQSAVSILRSIGVQHLCHDSDPSWEPFLPLCDDVTGGNVTFSDLSTSYGLRGSSPNLASGRMLMEHIEFQSAADERRFYTINIVGVFLCVCSVALLAGLFLGMLTLEVLDLRIIQRTSRDEDERLYADTILPIIEDRHRLLVTLLLLETLIFEALPLFLDKMVPTWVAVLLSTTLIMFFGEILPSGIFTGPHQLYLAYRLAPLTRVFLLIMYPFARPMAMVLDYLVEGGEGEDNGDGYDREELSALVRIQYEDSRGAVAAKNKRWKPRNRDDTWHATKQMIIERANENDSELDPAEAEQLAPALHRSEVDLIEGALQMKTVVIMDVYTPLSQVYAISDDLVLDKVGFTEIYRQGYSRVPVYRTNEDDPEDKTAIIGFLMVRQLMLIDWDHLRDVSTLPLQQPECVSPRMTLVDGLKILRSHGYLMAFVCARPDLGNKALQSGKPIPVEAGFLGIVTLQDVFESLLQERIYDEGDIRERDRAVATLQRWAATKLQDVIRRKAKILREKRQRSGSMGSTTSETTPLVVAGANGTYRYV